MASRSIRISEPEAAIRAVWASRVYEAPHNLFVAGFIGSPRMELIAVKKRIDAAHIPSASAPEHLDVVSEGGRDVRRPRIFCAFIEGVSDCSGRQSVRHRDSTDGKPRLRHAASSALEKA